MIPRHVLLSAGIAFSILAKATTAQEVGSVSRGLVLAQEVCAQCHAVQKQQGQSPDQDAPTFQDIASIPGMTTIALSVAITSSHRTMPNVMLDPDERADIIAYILALK
jgi:mono/diheme cytochrome c family protein